MKWKYCPQCGSRGLEYDGLKRFSCPECGWVFFFNAAAAVGVIIENEESDRILMLVRNQNPKKGFYDLPGGFVDPGEGAEEAARREVKEELGVEVHSLGYFKSLGNDYHYRGTDYTTCDNIFLGKLNSHQFDLDTEENAEALWLEKDRLRQSLDRIAFDSVRAALAEYLGSDDN